MFDSEPPRSRGCAKSEGSFSYGEYLSRAAALFPEHFAKLTARSLSGKQREARRIDQIAPSFSALVRNRGKRRAKSVLNCSLVISVASTMN